MSLAFMRASPTEFITLNIRGRRQSRGEGNYDNAREWLAACLAQYSGEGW